MGAVPTPKTLSIKTEKYNAEKRMSQAAKNNSIGGNFFLNQNQTTNEIKAPMPQKENLPEIWNIPPENKNFTGRSELLNNIKAHFEKNNDLLALIACHGLGGIGKTQLALKFVWENYTNYKGVCWFSAESSEVLILDYIELGNELNLFNDDKLSSIQCAKLVKSWLENHSGWLLIYDNVSKYEDIDSLLPVKGGRILITSRHTEWPGEKLMVDVFSQTEARSYVEKITGIRNEHESTDMLIKELGFLPLALAQASAYIKKMKMTLKDYLNLYHKIKDILLSEKTLPTGGKHNPVAITWNITLQKMQEESPQSVDLLYFACFFHNENIPQDIFKLLFHEENEGLLTFKCNKAKSVAEEYSMITLNSVKKSFSIHCLVQEVIRNQLHKEGKLLNYLQSGIAALLKTYPYGKDKNEDIQLKRELLPHLEIMLNNRDEHSEKLNAAQDREQLENILTYLSEAYGDLGNAQKQKQLLKRALAIQKERYGEDNPIVARTLTNLGNAYGYLGNDEKKKELLECALAIQEKHYRQNSPGFSITLTNLGNAYVALKNAEKGKELIERALAIFEKHYEKEDPSIGIILTSLGNAYGDLGNVQKKKDLLERALIIYEEYYGQDHYQVAITLTNLGNVYIALKNAKKGKELLERALAIFEKHYGEDHPHVSNILTNICPAYIALDDPQKSKESLKRALRIRENHYGKDHYEIAITLGNLGITYSHLGKTEKNRDLLERALHIQENYYGKNHYEVANVLASLGKAYGDLGDAQKGKELLERALFISEKYYGDKHTIVITVKSFLEDILKLLSTLRKFQSKNENNLPSIEVALRRAAGHGSKEDMEYLIKKIRGINSSSPTTGQTALHVAVIKGKKENVSLLLAPHANPDITDSEFKTARDYDEEFKLIEKCCSPTEKKVNHKIESENNYNYFQKNKVEDTTLITYLKEKTTLRFFGICDEKYKVDAIVEISTKTDKKCAEKLQNGLNGYGRFFKINEHTEGFILEGINLPEENDIQQSVGNRIQNYLAKW